LSTGRFEHFLTFTAFGTRSLLGTCARRNASQRWGPHDVINRVWLTQQQVPATLRVFQCIIVGDFQMAKAARKASGPASKGKKRGTRVSWSKSDVAELKKHSKSKSPVDAVAKAMKRTAGALRQKAYALGLPLGHRR
jgi:hypothetical protein